MDLPKARTSNVCTVGCQML